MGRLKRWLGFDYEEGWKRLAAEMDGHVRERSWGSGLRVDVDAGEWTFTLDLYVVPAGSVPHYYTRLRAPYVNPTGFRFKVFPQGFAAQIGKVFGMRDVEIGVPEFDRRWIVQGSDDARLRTIFATPRIREALAAAGDVSFAVTDDEGWFGRKFPQGVDELVLTTYGIVSDVERLKRFFELFAVTLERLVETGDASERAPGVDL